MASTYQDIIRIRGGRAAYNLESESESEWESFIPNEQFNGVLQKVLHSVRGNDIDNHKSFWLNGTYGTGKSHAVAVISHLLGDPLENIKSWIELEYGSDKFEVYKNSILTLRQRKRLLTVKLYGLEAMTHTVDLALIVQQAVLASLRKNDIEVSVQSDFERCIAHISTHRAIWQSLIDSNPRLAASAPTIEILVNMLEQGDVGIYHLVVDALRNTGLGALRQNNAKLKDWLIEVQNELTAKSDYNGLLLVWDEFTDVMRDPIGVQVLKALQEVADTFMAENNNSYLFLISHPSAFNTIDAEQLKQTDGRYHRMKYNMEPSSAFRIMSRKFEISDRTRHERMQKAFYEKNGRLLETYNLNTNDHKATEDDLRALFPLHPGTANLATHYATVVGAATRGVFEFLAQNDAIRHFLSDSEKFHYGDTITADYLWDYILKDLQSDIIHYGAVTERYNSYVNKVRNKGEAHFAIFKSLLLLNAFNNVSGSSNFGLITPSEDNIKNLYEGTRFESQVDDVLQWLSDEAVIQRAPGGMYSVQYSALPPIEIEEKKLEMRNVKFRRTYMIADFGAGSIFEKRFMNASQRPFSYGYFSDEENDSILRNKIKKGRKETPGHSLFFALLLARNNEELAKLRTFAETCAADSDDKDLQNIVIIVFDEVFTDSKYEQFIEYMANKECAAKRTLADQSKSHNDNAQSMVKEWMESIYRNNATIHISGKDKEPVSVKRLPTVVKDYIIPLIYPYAPEAHEQLRNRAPQPFWKTQNSKGIARTMLFAKSFSEVLELSANMRYIQHLMQDCLDENLSWKKDVPNEHPLKKVCSTIDSIIKRADKSQTFIFDEKFDLLTKPPYGFYPNFANMAMLAFAMRPWVKKIFDLQGKPRDENAMVDDMDLLFKVWDGSKKAGGKLSFKFQTPEEGKLCKELVSLFSLDKKNKEYENVSSLTNAKYALNNYYINKEKRIPLWALKYVSTNTLSHFTYQTELPDSIKKLIDNIVKICTERELRNPALVNDTLRLIDEQRIDIKNLLNVETSFDDGFKQFLLRLDKVSIQEDELNEVIKYIFDHSERTVGYWTEDEVTDKAKDWRLLQLQPEVLPAPDNGQEDDTDGTWPTVKGEAPKQEEDIQRVEKLRTKARMRIEKISSLDEAMGILITLCDEGNEWLLARIAKQ